MSSFVAVSPHLPRAISKNHGTKIAFEMYCTHLQNQIPLFEFSQAKSDPLWLIKDVLYHIMLPLVPNALREYYQYYNIDLKNFPFQALLEKAGALADQINMQLLKKIEELIIYIESDETFKGRKTIFLVVIDKQTGFLLFFKQIPNRKQETISEYLTPLKTAFPNLKVVFTDLAVYYPKVISSVFSGTDHQLCLIHGLRTLFKEFNKIRFRYHKLLGNWKDQTHILTTLKENIRWRQKTHSKKNSKLRKLLTQRTDLYLQLGISENQKGIYQQYPETFKLMEKINARRAEVRSMGQTLMNNYVKRAKCQQELVYLEVEKNARWAEYMESRRLWTRFKSLLQGNFEDFQNAWKRMTEILRKAHKKKNLRLFVAKIQHLMKDFPNLFTLAKDHKNHVLSPNFWNTNRVESFNGIFRLFSDLRRHFPSTHQTNSLCALWQLYYNTTARRSKQGDKMSPIERFGINLHGMDWVDLLFKPLPMMSVVGDII